MLCVFTACRHSFLKRFQPQLLIVCAYVYFFSTAKKGRDYWPTYLMWTGFFFLKELTTIEALPDFMSTTGGERSVQRGVVEACGKEENHNNSRVAPKPRAKFVIWSQPRWWWWRRILQHRLKLQWTWSLVESLTFLLYGFQQFGQHGRRSVWKAELLGQVQQTGTCSREIICRKCDINTWLSLHYLNNCASIVSVCSFQRYLQ